MTSTSRPGPLSGIRVLDLTAVFSGPIATAILADQGAYVIKVEPLLGDTSRRVGPAKGDLSASFIAANRGKRGIALDLKHASAQPILQALVRWADVLAENFRPGTLDRFGLDRDTLARLNPRLVRLSITGFGPDGPRAAEPAYDAVIQALSGISASHRDKATGQPSLLSTTICDKLTALTAAQAVTAALLARERDGRGRLVEVAMLDAAIAFQWVDAMYNHAFLDDVPQGIPDIGLTLKPYATADGLVAVMGPQQSEFQALCRALGHPEVSEDPRFSTQVQRNRHPREARATLEPLFAQMTTADLEAACRREGAPLGRVHERDAVMTDPQVQHNATVVTVDHGDVGRVRLARPAARFDGAALAPAGLAPHLGQHGREVLAEMGVEPDAIQALLDAGVLQLP
ncbi:MAG: CaiB/BaiF CoA transferase family protein [Aquabacterium sp.]